MCARPIRREFAIWEHEAADAEDRRPIHYLGSKLRLLDVTEELVDDVNPIPSSRRAASVQAAA